MEQIKRCVEECLDGLSGGGVTFGACWYVAWSMDVAVPCCEATQTFVPTAVSAVMLFLYGCSGAQALSPSGRLRTETVPLSVPSHILPAATAEAVTLEPAGTGNVFVVTISSCDHVSISGNNKIKKNVRFSGSEVFNVL